MTGDLRQIIFLLEKLYVLSMKLCMVCYQLVTRYECGKIFCNSRGYLQPPDFCECYVNRDYACAIEKKQNIEAV